MTAGEQPGKPVGEFGRSGSTASYQSIESQYYNITDANSWPVAGLLVLLDGQRQPVRAELHLYGDLPSHIQEGAVRQSRAVLQERYVGGDPLPLRILQTNQMRDAMDVRLGDADSTSAPSRQPSRWPILAGVGAVIAVLLVALTVWFGRDNEVASTSDSAPITEETAAQMAGAQVPAGDAESLASLELSTPEAAFPPSKNASPDIGIGMQVEIQPGLKLTLRSEPSADDGFDVGYMMDEESVTVIGGPEYSQGTSDTIVWWYVQLEDGTEAWAAANTSEVRLLVPVQ